MIRVRQHAPPCNLLSANIKIKNNCITNILEKHKRDEMKPCNEIKIYTCPKRQNLQFDVYNNSKPSLVGRLEAS